MRDRISPIVAQAHHTADSFIVLRCKCVACEASAMKQGVYDVEKLNLNLPEFPCKIR